MKDRSQLANEQLVSTVRERAIDMLGSRLAAECLMTIADHGRWFTHRSVIKAADVIAHRYGDPEHGVAPDLSQIEQAVLSTFVHAVGIQPLFENPDIPPGLTQDDMDWLEGGHE